MKVEFLGTGSCLPENAESDTASLLINGNIMVDTGWMPIRNLKRIGLEAHNVKYLFFTHMHQDHYMGLAALLFYLENGDHSFDSIKIYGPELLKETVGLALVYSGWERSYREEVGYPSIQVLKNGDVIDTGDILAECCESQHAVPSFSYKFTDKKTGKYFVYTGDTQPFEALIPFTKGAEVLIHEASFDVRERPSENPYRHSSCMDAANAAKEANVKALYMVHASGASREATLQKAGEIFPNVFRPTEGDSFVI